MGLPNFLGPLPGEGEVEVPPSPGGVPLSWGIFWGKVLGSSGEGEGGEEGLGQAKSWDAEAGQLVSF